MKGSLFLCALFIAAVSFLALATTTVSAVVQMLIALPGSAGLLVALWDLVKGRIEHERQLEAARQRHAFELSASSHMAIVAFDKHVEFCEAYVTKVHETLDFLIRQGPHEDVLNHARELYLVRRKFALWQTADVSAYLDRFEAALRKMGAQEHLLRSLPIGEKRTRVVDLVHGIFGEVMGFKGTPAEATSELETERIISHLREHLGISDLTKLRQHYLDEAKRLSGVRM